MNTGSLSSTRTKLVSLIDIFKYDDTDSLNFYMRSNPEISKSTYITYTGEKLPVGAISAAIHYKAIKCLQMLPITVDSYGERMGGPSAAHIACENQWEPGLLFLIKNKVPINTFDHHSKSPLAYVADHENIKFFKIILKYFEENGQIETGLKNVAIGREGSVNFLSYCIDKKKIFMIEACNSAMKKGFISKSEIKSAIERWNSKNADIQKPLFLKTFEKSSKLQEECEIDEFFSPLVPSSKFDEITSPYSIPIFDVITKINKICELANFKSFNLPEKKFLTETFNEFPQKILFNEIYTKYFSTYKISKSYFTDFFNKMKKIEKSNFYLPVTDNVPIPEVFEQFGLVLAHVGYTGFHYHFETPLHPLIYTILTFENPNKIDEMRKEDIEEYFQVIKSNKSEGINFSETRKKCFEQFLKNDKEFDKQYDSTLKQMWDIEIMKYKMILFNIYKGFYRETTNRQFSLFQQEIKKSNVTTLRFWFEGINLENPISRDKKIQIVEQLNFKLFIRNVEGEEKKATDFIQLIKLWMLRTDSKTVMNFLSALSGVKILLPIDSFYKTINIISNPMENQHITPHPYIIVPNQEGVLPILNSKQEIDELVSRTLNNGNIEYIEQEQLFKGLISI